MPEKHFDVDEILDALRPLGYNVDAKSLSRCLFSLIPAIDRFDTALGDDATIYPIAGSYIAPLKQLTNKLLADVRDLGYSEQDARLIVAGSVIALAHMVLQTSIPD